MTSEISLNLPSLSAARVESASFRDASRRRLVIQRAVLIRS